MDNKTQMSLSVEKENIEPYQYQLIEKKFSLLLRSFTDDIQKEQAILKIHSSLQRGYSEESICGMFTGLKFPLAHCITFASGKGGVGKSMLSVNTAVYYSNIGKKVLLFDADYGLSNAHIYLNFRTSKSLLDFFLSGDVEDALETISPRLDYIHTGSGELNLADMDEHEFTRIKKMLISLARNYDVIIMDLSPGISKDVIQTLLMGRYNIVVTTPQVSSITDTYALIKVLCQTKMSLNISLVVNMARSVMEANGTFQKISLCAKKFLKVDVDYLGNILYSSKISQSLNRRLPAINSYPDDIRSAGRIVLLAQNILKKIKQNGQKEV